MAGGLGVLGVSSEKAAVGGGVGVGAAAGAGLLYKLMGPATHKLAGTDLSGIQDMSSGLGGLRRDAVQKGLDGYKKFFSYVSCSTPPPRLPAPSPPRARVRRGKSGRRARPGARTRRWTGPGAATGGAAPPGPPPPGPGPPLPHRPREEGSGRRAGRGPSPFPRSSSSPAGARRPPSGGPRGAGRARPSSPFPRAAPAAAAPLLPLLAGRGARPADGREGDPCLPQGRKEESSLWRPLHGLPRREGGGEVPDRPPAAPRRPAASGADGRPPAGGAARRTRRGR